MSTGDVTKYVLSGDPVAGTGWVDGVQLPPGDRRMVMASGPFTMDLGQQQDVVLALIGGMGGNAISSVTVAKFHDEAAQYAYNNSFDLPSAPETPVVAGFGLDGAVSLDWGSNEETVTSTELSVSKGFEFEGYNIYQIPTPGSPLSEGKKIATYDKVNLLKDIFDRGVDPVSGYILQQVKQSGTDSGVQRHHATDYDELRERPMSNGIAYHFAVTAYSYLPSEARSFDDLGNPTDPFISLESTPAIVTVVPHTLNPGQTIETNAGGMVNVTHNGTANASVNVMVVNPDELTGDDYKVYFDTQYFYRDLDGNWIPADNPDGDGTLAKAMDCTGSSVTGAAIASANLGTVDLTFSFDMNCGNNWVDGIVIDMPDDLVINPGWGTPVTGTGGNLDNSEGTLDASTNTITWGNNIQSGYGGITGNVVWVVNVQPPASYPLSFSYTVHDDGYDETVVDATGDFEITELGFEYKSEKHWNLANVTDDAILLQDQTILNGADLYGGNSEQGDQYLSPLQYLASAEVSAPTIEGFKLNIVGNYAAPINYLGISDNAGFYGSSSYTIGSYFDYGWAATAKATDTYGNGATSVDVLQRDVKVVWDGVFGSPDENNFVPVVEGGSQVWIHAARFYDLADHPANPNPGSSDPFLITVPFKVYDMEQGDEPVQISVIIYDRIQDPTSGASFYAFNPSNRMYTHWVNRPYEETLADFSSNEAFLTWNTVWWGAPYEVGDHVLFQYANPIQVGVDEFVWTSSGFSTGGTITQSEIDMISVYPNPYYGFHELETSRSDKYVSFNHLPEKATIRIFNLGGTMVKQIDKDDLGQFANWDLSNQYGYPVASGLYIVHVDTPYGEKILKLALVQETQVLKYY